MRRSCSVNLARLVGHNSPPCIISERKLSPSCQSLPVPVAEPSQSGTNLCVYALNDSQLPFPLPRPSRGCAYGIAISPFPPYKLEKCCRAVPPQVLGVGIVFPSSPMFNVAFIFMNNNNVTGFGGIEQPRIILRGLNRGRHGERVANSFKGVARRGFLK
jgi:hypothetical protein